MFLGGFVLWVVGWVWSVVNGFRVGLLCGGLNFFFPPLSQLIFSIYEPKIRKPALFMALGFALMTWSVLRIGWHEFSFPTAVPGGVFT
jgi:hypothetical protein